MFIKQLSIILENRKGAMAEWTTLLSKNNIDLIATTVVDTTDHGVLRAVVNDPEAAVELLRREKYAVTVTDVIAVALYDHPGALSEVMCLLAENDICVEYIYSFLRQVEGDGVMVLRTNLPGATRKLFEEKNVPTISQEQLKGKKSE